MVHPFFNCVRANPATVNVYANINRNGAERFSSAFKILFPPTPFRQGDPVVSWLNAIESSFEFNGKGNVPKHVYKRVSQLFERFDFDEEEDEYSPLFQFFLYLFWIFYMAERPLEHESVFKFMTGFNINLTRVVLVGQDPREEGFSSGFAFHEAICESSKFILEAVQQESEVFDELGTPNLMELADWILDRACSTCSMRGWIDQKVLLINSALSNCQDENRDMMNAWKIFTDFVVEYLSDTRESIVFIFAGGIASKKECLVDESKHLILNVYHPARYSYGRKGNEQSSLKWSRVLPFFNANLFLHQKFGADGMIDWNSIRGSIPGRQRRLQFMEHCFSRLYAKASRLRYGHGDFEKMGSLLLFKNESDDVFVRGASDVANLF